MPSVRLQCRAPWADDPPHASRTGYNSARDTSRASYPGHLAEVHRRRSDEELAAVLAERLAELRADPPPGYPDRLPRGEYRW